MAGWGGPGRGVDGAAGGGVVWRWGDGEEQIGEVGAERGGEGLGQAEIVTGDEGEQEVDIRRGGAGAEREGEEGENLQQDHGQQVRRPRLAGALAGAWGETGLCVWPEGWVDWHEGVIGGLAVVVNMFLDICL